MLSRLVITFLPRSKRLLISWLHSPFAVILATPEIKSATVSPSICPEAMGLDAMILVFWMLSFKPTFSLSSFTFIKRLFSSLLSAIGLCHLHIWGYWCSWHINYTLSQSPDLVSRVPEFHVELFTQYHHLKVSLWLLKWKVKLKVKSLSRVRLFATPWTVTCTRLLCPWDFLGKNTGVGCHFLLQVSNGASSKIPIQLLTFAASCSLPCASNAAINLVADVRKLKWSFISYM